MPMIRFCFVFVLMFWLTSEVRWSQNSSTNTCQACCSQEVKWRIQFFDKWMKKLSKKTDSASFPGTWKVDTSTCRHKNPSQLSFYYITERDTRTLRQSQKDLTCWTNSVLCLNCRSSIKNSLEWAVLRTWVVSLSRTILKLSLAFSPYFNSGCVSTQTDLLPFIDWC